MDIRSEGFKSLPLEYQHEILEELKEQTKHNTACLSAVAQEDKAEDFSSFQIGKLIKSNKLTNKVVYIPMLGFGGFCFDFVRKCRGKLFYFEKQPNEHQ